MNTTYTSKSQRDMDAECAAAIEAPFTLEDIEDVKIIIQAKGKHYSILANKLKTTDEDARYYRIALAQALISMQEHIIVTPSLEEIRTNKNSQ